MCPNQIPRFEKTKIDNPRVRRPPRRRVEYIGGRSGLGKRGISNFHARPTESPTNRLRFATAHQITLNLIFESRALQSAILHRYSLLVCFKFHVRSSLLDAPSDSSVRFGQASASSVDAKYHTVTTWAIPARDSRRAPGFPNPLHPCIDAFGPRPELGHPVLASATRDPLVYGSCMAQVRVNSFRIKRSPSRFWL